MFMYNYDNLENSFMEKIGWMTAKDVEIEIDVTATCGLVLQQAGQSIIRGVRVKNASKESLVGMSLTMSSDIGLFHPLSLTLDSVQPGETISVQVPDSEPKLDYGFLSTLADVRHGEVLASLAAPDGTERAFVSVRHTVYAPDQTLGFGRPIYYASFVVPQCDAVARLQSDVAKLLEAETGRASIVGYLHEKSDVYDLCKAIFRAVQGLGIAYAVPPATFGQPGQKVRLPDEVFKYKTGCCLDTTLLFASVFEKCGLRPVLIMVKEHAFVGCHLTDKSFADPVVSDAETLRKALQEDMFIALETTLVGSNASFAEAESSAKLKLQDDASFECAIDVALARGMGVHPLPVAPGGGFGEVDGRDVNARDEATRELTEDIDLDALGGTEGKDSAEARVEGWAQRLLDLSKANRLLNVRGNAKVVPIICSSPATLEDAIAADSGFRVKSFQNYLDAEAGRAFQKLDAVAALEQYRDALEKSLREYELWSTLPRRETERRLKEIYRAARVDLEEGGVNTLFLSIGVLEWCEADAKPGTRYRAPILLVPVRIERRSVADGYRIRRIDEETAVNTTLLELLRREYGINVPGLDPLPTDDSGVDVAKVLGIFRAAVRNLRGLCVTEDCLVGQFSFGKFVMWKDLTSRIDAVRANPIVAHLISRRGAYDDGVEVFPPAEVDRHLDYSSLCCPLSADASQLAAVLYSALGKTFVLHGPPGTGKSQTITNIIAHNLSLGRRVLFVSEKKAALDVVYGRLARLGLAPFCLQLHSNKAGKAEVYAQFSEALKVGAFAPSGEWTDTVKETEAMRRQLDGYVKALHRQTVSGFTPYDLFSRLVSGEIDGNGALVAGNARETTAAEYDQARRAIAVAAEMREGIPAAAVKALARVKPFAWSPGAEARLAEDAARMANELHEAVAELAAVGGVSDEASRFLKRYLGFVKKVREFEKNVSAAYDLNALRKMPVKELRRKLGEADRAFVVMRLVKERALVRAYASVAKDGALDRVRLREALKLSASLQDADEELAKMEPRAKELLGKGFDPKTTDPDDRLEVRARAELRLEQACGAVAGVVDGDASEFVPAKAAELAELMDEIAVHARGNLRQAFIYFEARRGIPAMASAVADALDGDDEPAGDLWSVRFAEAFQSKLLNEIMESEPAFGSFRGAGREAVIARFRELDEKCARLARTNLVAKLSAAVPRNDGRVRRGDTSELGLLMHECGKKMRQKPVRQILAETPTLTPAIKPCFLMSPLSVAQYLPVDAAFDLVVFDEASQMPVWDAIGVIARGKQLVVVGDPKQLPPTSFFQKGADEDAEVEDLESILDECLHAGFMSCFLGWHYRSRHESLIAFSNHRYYESGLNVFPAAEQSDRVGVSFVHVPDGIYEASGSRTNRREAETVADLVVRQVSDPAFAGKTIGVVTFSEAQRDLVEDLVDERRAAHPELESCFAEREAEPFFVKNLENVQGDERDAIIFSIGYAPDANGKFNMVFGPLSNQGGERRLNVAITRARERIIVVSSIHGRQIDTDRVTTQGPADLRAFLEYAEKGYRIALPQETFAEDRFAAEVARTLEKAGAKVSRDVGCGANRVDVAVRAPDDDARYVMGVECDGCGYACELTARDRDRLRDEVLASLGWNIYHVWVVDWAYDRTRAEKRLLEAFEKSTKRKEEQK